jgi:sulfonate transport system permease protein
MPDTMMPFARPVDVLAPRPPKLRRAFGVPLAVRRLASTLILLAIWQAGYEAGLISPRVLAPPSAILLAAWTIILDGTLPYNLLISLTRVVVGLSIALALGVPLALLSGLSRAGEDAVDAPLQMVRTLPHLALVPLFILWFGIGETPKIALVALGSVFPIYLNLVAGIRGVDPKLVEAGRTLGLSRFEMIRHVILPGAMPGFLVGLRYAVGVAWLSLVVGEQINADSGIGYMMMDARDFLRTDIILVGLLTYALLGLLGDQGVRLLERRVLAWRPGGR